MATEDDVKPGAKLGMMMVNTDGTLEYQSGYPSEIVLNDPPVRFSQELQRDYVYYKMGVCQCFVPKSNMIDRCVERTPSGPYAATLYLVKRS